MTDEKKKMTAQDSSVGADDGQSISTNFKFTIQDPEEKSNSPERDLEELYRKMRRMSDPAYLHTVTLEELMDNVFEGKSAVIENLLYTGAYILAGAPKIGKSFLVAQLVQHSGQLVPQGLVDPGVTLDHHIPAKQPPDDVVLLGQAGEFDRRLDLGILFRGDPKSHGLVPPTVVLVQILC